MDYGNLAEYQRERALQTKLQLDLLVQFGKIDERLLRGRVLDWGAGYGVGTQALNNFSGYVEAVDISDSVDEIANRGILPKERVYKTDGIQFMREHPDTYDTIASFLFGPLTNERDAEFLRNFYQTACGSINSEGRILLTSDIGSFKYIERLARSVNREVLCVPSFPSVFIGKKSK